MRVRSLLVLSVLAGGLVAVPPAAAAPPALAGTTIVSGTGVGAMTVRIPRDVTLSLKPTDDWAQGVHATFRGRGRLLSLMLRSARDKSETWLMRSTLCMARGCDGTRKIFNGVGLGPRGFTFDQTRLRAGTYTLYWMADGRAASVSVKLPGLRGRTALRPPPLYRAQQWGPTEVSNTVEPTTGFGVRTYAGETEAPMPGEGLLLGVSWAASSQMDANESVCLIEEDDPARAVPLGACPAGVFGWRSHTLAACLTCLVTDIVLPSGEMLFGHYVWLRIPKGDYELRAYAEFAGRFGHVGLTTGLLPYR